MYRKYDIIDAVTKFLKFSSERDLQCLDNSLLMKRKKMTEEAAEVELRTCSISVWMFFKARPVSVILNNL